MSDYPLVSVGVASFNNSNYIIETLESVKNQSYSNIELVIVDDCSKDNSVEVIEKWISCNNINCKFIKNSKNLGLTKVCNILLKESSGKYFSVLGSDDIYLENKIYNQLLEFERFEETVVVIYSDVYVIDEAGNMQIETFLNNNNYDIEKMPSGKVFFELAKQNFIPAMSVLCKRDILLEVGGYDESLAYEDLDMWLKISLKYNIVFSKYVSAKYRIHSKSLWSTRGLAFQISNINIMIKYLNYDNEVDSIFKKRLAFEIEDVYRLYGRKYLNLLRINYQINKNLKNFIFLAAGTLNIDFSTLDKLNNIIKLKFLKSNSFLI